MESCSGRAYSSTNATLFMETHYLTPQSKVNPPSSLLLIANEMLVYHLFHSTFSPLICMLVFLIGPFAP